MRLLTRTARPSRPCQSIRKRERVADESLIEFPCDLAIKVMGRHTPDFEAQMVAAAATQAGPIGADAVSVRLSKDERFASVTLTLHVQDHDQLRRIYGALHATGLVLYAL